MRKKLEAGAEVGPIFERQVAVAVSGLFIAAFGAHGAAGASFEQVVHSKM